MAAAMGDPSQGIPPQLIHHIHLICTYPLPYAPMLPLQQAFQYLVDAPRIVKQMAPMRFQYLVAPQDGTTFLTYSLATQQEHYPSDGYIWSGQEERVVQEYNGYTIEAAVAHTGFRPGVDTMTCHQRRRYRIVQKNPNVNASPPDRNLWIVNYARADLQRMLPIAQAPFSPMQGAQAQQRAFIEQQGRLETHEFFLHDREKWPMIKFVQGKGFVTGTLSGQSGGNSAAAAHLGNARFGGQHYQQQAQGQAGPSPAKRQRTSTVGAMMPGMQVPDFVDEDLEGENHIGDVLDVMSQREVSFHRFKQHHEWMEEVISSPYAVRQIEPVYLGLGLMGELSGLTKGVFETVEDAARQLLKEEPTDGKTNHIGRIPSEKLKEFQTRVEQYLGEGQLELQRMKEQHAAKVAEIRKGKSLLKAEKRLGNARWLEGGSTGPVLNGLVSGRNESLDRADDIVAEVEQQMGMTIGSQGQLRLVESGGLKEKVVHEPEVVPQAVNGTSGEELFSMGADVTQGSSTAKAPLPSVEGGAAALPQPAPSQAAQQQQQQQQQQQGPAQAPPQSATMNLNQPAGSMDVDQDEGLPGLADEGNFNIDDMDLDMTGNDDFDFDAAGTSGMGTPQVVAAATGSSQQGATTTAGSADAAQSAAATSATANEAAIAAHRASQTAAAAAVAAAADELLGPSFQPTPGDNSAFDEFTAGDDEEDGGADNTAGELLDFGDEDGGGAGGLEEGESAFGEAFHHQTEGGGGGDGDGGGEEL